MSKLHLPLACLVFALCATIPPITRESLPALFASLATSDSVCAVKGFGELGITAGGRRLTATIELQWRGDSDFTLNLYSPFGGLIASAAGDSTGEWTVSEGTSSFKKLPRDSVELGHGMIDYPFSYSDFLHILSGRLPDCGIMRKDADSLFLNGKKAFLHWYGTSMYGRTMTVTAIINRKHSSVTDVIYHVTKEPAWDLTFSSFTRGVAKEIRFKDAHKNYFHLSYEKMISWRGGECRDKKW